MSTAAIQDALMAKLDAEGLTTKLNELFEVRDIDAGDPAVLSQVGNTITITTESVTLNVTATSITRVT